jgi:hypothetical protein
MLFWLSAVVCSSLTVLGLGAYGVSVLLTRAVEKQQAKQKADIPYGK